MANTIELKDINTISIQFKIRSGAVSMYSVMVNMIAATLLNTLN